MFSCAEFRDCISEQSFSWSRARLEILRGVSADVVLFQFGRILRSGDVGEFGNEYHYSNQVLNLGDFIDHDGAFGDLFLEWFAGMLVAFSSLEVRGHPKQRGGHLVSWVDLSAATSSRCRWQA